MSTSLSFMAINLEQMRAFAGSGDEKLYKQLLREMDDWLQPADDDDLAAFREARIRLKSIIEEGIVESKKKERQADATAFCVLAKHAALQPQPWDEEADGELPWDDLHELSRQFKKRFDQRTRVLFDYLVVGRALTGKGFSHDADWYAYLTTEELKELQDGLLKVVEPVREMVAAGSLNKQDFDSSLVDVIDYVLEPVMRMTSCGADLFVYAC
jgi:hypothetical protein